MSQITDTPEALVQDGKVQFGAFRSPFTNLNMLDADPFGLGGLLPKAIKRFRLKEWQHFAVVTKTHFIGLAVVDAKFMGATWCYALNRKTGEMIDHARQVPLKTPNVSSELLDNRFSFEASGLSVDVHNHLADGGHTVSFSAKTKNKQSIEGELEIQQTPEIVQPLIRVLPIGDHSVFYTHKVPCPVSGTLTIGDEEIKLNPKKDFALLDIHKSFYPYRTWWKWATFAGRDSKGKIIGANLTVGLHGASGEGNENCIWHGNKISLLSDVEYEIQDDIMAPWKIRTTDGRADLVFTPQGIRQETIDFKVFVSWYKAPLGVFSGTLTDDDGKVHKVKDLFGIAEHHRVTW